MSNKKGKNSAFFWTVASALSRFGSRMGGKVAKKLLAGGSRLHLVA
jgi:hypothetical protein